MQPWDFVVVRNQKTKRAVKQLFLQANKEAGTRYHGEKANVYRNLKLEGIWKLP